jgi:hypothetical protein
MPALDLKLLVKHKDREIARLRVENEQLLKLTTNAGLIEMRELRAANERLAALVKLYEEYTELAKASEAGMIGLAYTHGYATPPEFVERGYKLRAKIEALTAAPASSREE